MRQFLAGLSCFESRPLKAVGRASWKYRFNEQPVLLSDFKVVENVELGIPTAIFHQKSVSQKAKLIIDKSKMQQLSFEDPFHNEPYNMDMESKEWKAIATSVRRRFGAPKSQEEALEEQRTADREWRSLHPYFYHAFGPRGRTSKSPSASASPSIVSHIPASSPTSSPTAHQFSAPSPTSPPTPRARNAVMQGVPATVLAPKGDNVRDFDGSRAVIARLPRLGDAPTELTDFGKEVRGSFAARVFDASGQPEETLSYPLPLCSQVEVTRMASGPTGPFQCEVRGYRGLTGDFTGNVVHTGFHQEYLSQAGRVQTGAAIPPTGDPLAFDILTCRDDVTREVQYFRIEPARVLERMPDDSTLA